ncbi:hypothetical protein [Vibrio taketomensis]|uniref:hypothetical protein n=1 Tax=Vibrio taketomensis TaxID=2572923 RepID=UPI00138A0AF6|nr:hypothetical protein [Vibrio taketomensis]
MTLNRLSIVMALTTALSSFYLAANPTPDILNNYYSAAEGNEEMVDTVYSQLKQLVDEQGAKPVTMVYLGSTQTFQGRDALLPWNQMKYVEKGLATIAKGVNMIDSLPIDINEQERIQGLPEAYLTQAIAAITYTSLPDMFNHFERGYDLYLELLNDPQFSDQPFAASSWIYLNAIQAAIRAKDLTQAQTWLATMQSLDANNAETQTAQQLLADLS